MAAVTKDVFVWGAIGSQITYIANEESMEQATGIVTDVVEEDGLLKAVLENGDTAVIGTPDVDDNTAATRAENRESSGDPMPQNIRDFVDSVKGPPQ